MHNALLQHNYNKRLQYGDFNRSNNTILLKQRTLYHKIFFSNTGNCRSTHGTKAKSDNCLWLNSASWVRRFPSITTVVCKLSLDKTNRVTQTFRIKRSCRLNWKVLVDTNVAKTFRDHIRFISTVNGMHSGRSIWKIAAVQRCHYIVSCSDIWVEMTCVWRQLTKT